jgi:hypothetical protein
MESHNTPRSTKLTDANRASIANNGLGVTNSSASATSDGIGGVGGAEIGVMFSSSRLLLAVAPVESLVKPAVSMEAMTSELIAERMAIASAASVFISDSEQQQFDQQQQQQQDGEGQQEESSGVEIPPPQHVVAAKGSALATLFSAMHPEVRAAITNITADDNSKNQQFRDLYRRAEQTAHSQEASRPLTEADFPEIAVHNAMQLFGGMSQSVLGGLGNSQVVAPGVAAAAARDISVDLATTGSSSSSSDGGGGGGRMHTMEANVSHAVA